MDSINRAMNVAHQGFAGDQPNVTGTAGGSGQKAVATLTARAAIAGYELAHLADGSFLISRWGLIRSLDHVAAVETFLRRVGAPTS